jgi:uncharacterized protein (DUF58 family)
MRPSRLLLWLLFAALALSLVAVIVPALPVDWALLPLAMVLVAAALDWVISVGPRSIEVSISHLREVFVGEHLEIDFKLNSKRKNGSLPRSEIKGRLAHVDGFETRGEFSFGKGNITLPVLAKQRGRWTIDRLWLYWKSRFGLIEFIPVRKIELAAAVVPNIRPITSGQIDFDMRTAIFGEKQTSQRGEGSEFHQLNDYVQGMDPRSIDWKHSARQNRLVAKEMRAERNHQIILAMDNGHLMREEINGLARIDHKINAALALAWAGVQGGDQVGLFAFDARPRQYTPAQPGRVAFARLRSQMAELQYSSIETNHTLALATLHERLNRRSLIVVFSDFVDPLSAELLLEHLAVLNRHHVLVFVSLHDPLLQNLVNDRVETMDGVARSVSASNLLAERRLVFEKMSSMGIDVIETTPVEMTPNLLNTYLAIKAKELI